VYINICHIKWLWVICVTSLSLTLCVLLLLLCISRVRRSCRLIKNYLSRSREIPAESCLPAKCTHTHTHNNKHVLSINNAARARLQQNCLHPMHYISVLEPECLCGHFNRAPINLRANKFCSLYRSRRISLSLHVHNSSER
jgi:hypothetical protein